MTNVFNHATWMTSPWLQDEPEQPRRNPIFRKTVCLADAVDSALIHICGLGHYELTINGSRVGDRWLEPAFTDYDKRVYYSTYEIGNLLVTGENVLALYLGRGRYNMYTVSVWGFENAPWRAPCSFISTGEIITMSGQSIALDTLDWKCTEGPIFRDSMYGGEGFDARLEQTGWQTRGFDDSSWAESVATEGPAGKLTPPDFEPIRVIDQVPVADKVFSDSTRVIYDFGDMLAGNVRIHVQEPAGTRIRIAYAEKCNGSQLICPQILVDGEHFQEDEYICRGGVGEEVWQARFSYKGFRYIEVSGFTTQPADDQVTALVIHNDVKARGSFECSNVLINQIHKACTTALLNNLHHIVTDTPTFEKNGWTGDAQLTVPMGLYNFQMEQFYRKFAADIRDSQQESGEIAPIVPTSGWGLTDHPNSKWERVLGAVPAWDAALFVLSWDVYQFSGNSDIIQENYRAMQKYLSFLNQVAKEHILEMGLGDWLPPADDPNNDRSGTPSEGPSISSTAWYFKLADILYNCAILVNDKEWQHRCQELKSAIYTAFNIRFLNQEKNGYESGSEIEYRQTSNILALAFGLVPQEHKASVLTKLKQDIFQNDQPRLNAGILGTRYVFDVLADNGDVDLAYALITSAQYPSWGFWFANGFVSLGESWELTSRSWSHHMYGSVDAWFYRYLAGIIPAIPGFKQVSIAPHLPAELDAFSASLELPAGRIRSSCKKENGAYIFEIELPVTCQGVFSLPVGLPDITLKKEFAEKGVPLVPGFSRIVINHSGEIRDTSNWPVYQDINTIVSDKC